MKDTMKTSLAHQQVFWLIVGEFNILFKVPVGVSTRTMIPNEDIVCIYHGPNRSDHYGATLILWTL